MTASTCAHWPDSRVARTVAVLAAPSTHTQVSMLTNVAPEPASDGFHRTVPVGRSIASYASSARTCGSMSTASPGVGSSRAKYRAGWASTYVSRNASSTP
jgi:hypothetical protein